MKLLGDYMLVRFDDAPTVTEGGLVIPDALRDDHTRYIEQRHKAPKIGTVHDIGPGTYTTKGALVPTVVRPGDRVLMDPLAELGPPDERGLRVCIERQCAGWVE